MRILVVDDNETLRFTLSSHLKQMGHETFEACNGKEAIEKVSQNPHSYHLIFLDINMPYCSGLEALKLIKKDDHKCLCVMLTAYADIKDAVYAIKNGAFDYIEKPLDMQSLEKILGHARKAHDLIKEIAHSAPQLYFKTNSTMIGGCSEITKVYKLIQKLAKVDSPALIQGESGTGKELVARAIHHNSKRKNKPFVAINCGAIPDNLIESELFGFEKGSFTGAHQNKVGKFQYAHEGTIFLDEIGDISKQMQVKLLRVLQEKSYTPLGSNKETKIDVRIIAASNKKIETLVQEEKFRLDLFYRINILPIELPPLRERKEDIPDLVNHLIEKFNKVFDHHIKGATEDCLNYLKEYSWPGNIRELSNVIERCFILEESEMILTETIKKNLNFDFIKTKSRAEEIKEEPPKELNNSEEGQGKYDDLDFQTMKENFEKDFIIKALQANSGKINKTASKTKMPKVTLLRKIAKYALNPKNYS